jgi:long-chain acyl-CoA synthetase
VSLKPEYKDKVAAQEIINFCRPRLAGFKRPKSVDLLDELPKNTVGKIAKQELKKQYRGGELSPKK